MKLASIIKSAREAAGLSQSQAAKAWGVPFRTLQNWEQGHRAPGGAHIEKLLPILLPFLGKNNPASATKTRTGERKRRKNKGT